MSTWYVKVRKLGAKRWAFLTPRGGTNYLRVHGALMTEERARTVAREIEEHNATDAHEKYEAKAVPA